MIIGGGQRGNMTRYSNELKASVLQKMMPPQNIPIAQLAQETGITETTLYAWRKKAKSQGVPVPGDGQNPEQWRSEDKFAVVLETAALNETELAEYCRKKGLYPEQVEQWKSSQARNRTQGHCFAKIFRHYGRTAAQDERLSSLGRLVRCHLADIR